MHAVVLLRHNYMQVYSDGGRERRGGATKAARGAVSMHLAAMGEAPPSLDLPWLKVVRLSKK